MHTLEKTFDEIWLDFYLVFKIESWWKMIGLLIGFERLNQGEKCKIINGYCIWVDELSNERKSNKDKSRFLYLLIIKGKV